MSKHPLVTTSRLPELRMAARHCGRLSQVMSFSRKFTSAFCQKFAICHFQFSILPLFLAVINAHHSAQEIKYSNLNQPECAHSRGDLLLIGIMREGLQDIRVCFATSGKDSPHRRHHPSQVTEIDAAPKGP